MTQSPSPTRLRRLAWALLALIAAFALCVLAGHALLTGVLEPIRALTFEPDQKPQPIAFAPGEWLWVRSHLALLFGFGAALPVLSYQLWHVANHHRKLTPQHRNARIFCIVLTLSYWAGLAIADWLYTPSTLNADWFLGPLNGEQPLSMAWETTQRVGLQHMLFNLTFFGVGFVLCAWVAFGILHRALLAAAGCRAMTPQPSLALSRCITVFPMTTIKGAPYDAF